MESQCGQMREMEVNPNPTLPLHSTHLHTQPLTLRLRPHTQVVHLHGELERLVGARVAAEEALLGARREAADAHGRAAATQVCAGAGCRAYRQACKRRPWFAAARLQCARCGRDQ